MLDKRASTTGGYVVVVLTSGGFINTEIAEGTECFLCVLCVSATSAFTTRYFL